MSANTITKSKASPRINPATIFAEIQAQPPLMRQEAAKAYIGKMVNWPVTFANASEQSSGQAHLIFRFDPHDMSMITGNVLLSDYPQLRALRSGERLRVRGTIRKIDQLFIELDISKLVFTHSSAPVSAEAAH